MMLKLKVQLRNFTRKLGLDRDKNLSVFYIGIILVFLLLSSTINCSTEDSTLQLNSKDGFFFILIADPQLFWGPVEAWETAITHANRLKPDFVVVCGDLIQHPGNEEEAKAYIEVANMLDEGIQLYNVPGNHDVGNHPTPQTYAWYEEHFGKLWYSFTRNKCLFIVLESDILRYPEGVPGASEEQIEWLKKTLHNVSKSEFLHKIIFMHHPMCLQDVKEDSSYFNMYPKVRSKLLELFHKYNIDIVFSGHYHRNAYVKDGELELVTTSSSGKPLGEDPIGFRIVKVYPDRIEHKYYSYKEMPEEVNLTSYTKKLNKDQ